ncbi:hypothetical protein FQA39_LY08458 [Lamprigera yunnana]|nr:hypothetical protein FQA39_LY08458 [Lamprigera yunnana]
MDREEAERQGILSILQESDTNSALSDQEMCDEEDHMPKWPRQKLKEHYEDSAILHLEKSVAMEKAVMQVIRGEKTLREAAVPPISKSALQRHIKNF